MSTNIRVLYIYRKGNVMSGVGGNIIQKVRCHCVFQVSREDELIIELDHIWDRPVTTKEHGIYKPYKGVYKCKGCGNERILDNQEEVLENNENVV